MGWNPIKDTFKFLDPNAPADEANAYEAKNTKNQLAAITAGGAAQDVGFGKAKAGLRSQLPIARKAFADARANLALTADRQTRTLMDREKSALATGQGQVFRAGGVGSNVGGLVSRGIRGDTTRAMQRLDEIFQRHFAELGIGEADALGQIQSQIAGMSAAQGRGGFQTGLAKANAIGGQQFIPGGGIGPWIEQAGKVAKIAASFSGAGV